MVPPASSSSNCAGATFRVVVLISGRGTNLQSLIDAISERRLKAQIVGVISNEPCAAGLQRAKAANIDTRVVSHRDFCSRAAFEFALQQTIDQLSPQLVVLAGFMRVLGEAFVNHYCGRLINIHPSLLPAFAGLNTHQRALDAAVLEHGASVHFVTGELDGGPIIAQRRVSVHPDDDADSLAARVLQQEHELLPEVVARIACGQVRLEGSQVVFSA